MVNACFKGFLNLVAAGVLMAAARPSSAQTVNTLSQEEVSAGWELLFDGASSAGWLRADGSPAQATLEDSALSLPGADICTQEDYQDFEFSADYKYVANGNSGILFRTRRGVVPTYRSGIEIAIQDNGRAGYLYKEGDAAVYGIKAPDADKWTGPGAWNTMRMRVSGTRIENFHNGEKVVDIDMASAEWDSLYAASKFSDGTWPLWGKDGKGQICLQYHGSRILFRNLKVLGLPAGAASRPKSPASGLRWEIRGSFADRRLLVDLPGVREYDVRLLDLSGKEVRALRRRSGSAGRAEIPLRDLPKGLYWLRVAGPDFSADRRIALF